MQETMKLINDEMTSEMNVGKKNVFAPKIGLEQCLWLFFLGSFLGVILEMIFCFVTTGNIENRTGLVWLPLNPVYGAGAVGLSLGLYNIRNSSFAVIFVRGFIIGGVIEYLSSWVQQILVGSISWNYSAQSFNVGGRTSLRYMIYWGIISIIWIKIVYPVFVKMIQKMPLKLGKLLTIIFSVIVVLDCGVSVVAINRWSARLDNIPAESASDVYMDKFFGNQRMKKTYPNMVFEFQSTFDSINEGSCADCV